MNKYQAVLDFIRTCPLVGEDMFFNFVDETNTDGNTTLATVPYGQVVKKYTDGMRLMRMQFEIRQIKPMSQDSNTGANAEEMHRVKQFLDWINAKGEKEQYPDWGDVEIIGMSTSNDVTEPSMVGTNDRGALYAFPFEILYLERI